MAQYLLANGGLAGMQGVVYLDGEDRKMILMRTGLKVMKLEQSGVAWGDRFSFYDQVPPLPLPCNPSPLPCNPFPLPCNPSPLPCNPSAPPL